MQITDQDQAYKLQGDFLSSATKNLQTLREGKALPVDTLVKDGQERIAAAKALLDSATKDRDEMVRRMDERIARLTDDVKRLETSVQELQRPVAPDASRPVAPSVSKPAAPGATKAGAKGPAKPS